MICVLKIQIKYYFMWVCSKDTVINPKEDTVYMFSVDAVDLFDICSTLWLLNTHLEKVASQVICFMSIYKTIVCEERGRKSHWHDSCPCTGCDLSIFGQR